MKKSILSLLLMLGMFVANAQFRKIPAEVTDSFKARYENASAVTWKDKMSYFQAEFKMGDKVMKANFSSKGEWLKTETKHQYATLPADVQDGFKKSKYATMEVKDVLQVEEKAKDSQYKVVVKKNDYNKKTLVFASNGQLLSDDGGIL